ncbi:hypothetical protein VHUM_02101 [Vanrija humicola]|uniref:Amino acid transporter transmembrane domain-containing protein n=1 Tax=Vanrija humicola TaxID=5417 RepID=A0A7D8YZS9_VANHU|nr:hypothetical protein VHUM_02101 [Vanrija humicola]
MDKKPVVYDAVFGELDDSTPNFKGLGAMGAFVLMTKANIGLGVLGVPFVFMTIGLVGGLILLIVMAVIVAYTASIIGPFKLNHPEMYSYSDAGYIVGGRWLREYFTVVFIVGMTFVCGGAIVSVSTALNALSMHGACTAIFIAVSAVAGFLLSSIRTLGNIQWLGWVGLLAIAASVLTMVVSVGVQDRPAAAPQTGAWDKDIKVFAHPPFATAMNMVSAVLFAYAATPTYFGIICEMREPRKYQRVMLASMGLTTVLYLVLGSIVYYFCGQYVSSPALGSAGVLMKKVCYGLALPGLLATLCIYSHVVAKLIFVRLLHGTEHLTKGTVRHWTTWLGCTFGVAATAYLLASAIPSFGAIISFIGAVFSPQGTVSFFPVMWWHDNWRFKAPGDRSVVMGCERNARNVWMAALNVFIFICGLFFVVGGLYAAIKDLIATKSTHGPWTCADNSGTVKSE